MVTQSLPPGEPCGLEVWDKRGQLLGFCERPKGHEGKCTHLMSRYEVERNDKRKL